MNVKAEVYDVCIVGGGPAGAALALRLAQLGRRIAIIEKEPFPRPHVGEALPAGILPLLDVLGLRSSVEAAGFLRSNSAMVNWAGETRRSVMPGEPGFLVDRAAFDALLLRAACQLSGVSLYQPARVVRASREREQWHVQLHSGACVQAQYLAEACGRTRLRIQMQGKSLPFSKRALGAPTLALYAYWRNPNAELPGTLVESGQNAWYWAAPLPNGVFNAMVCVEPTAKHQYHALLQQAQLLLPYLQGAQQASALQICDATPFVDTSPISASSAHYIKVGESALAIDPLSSQGVQTAIGGALHAAIALNTLLSRPAHAALAREFYASRIQQSAQFHCQAAARFYEQQARLAATPFWLSRSTHATAPRVLPALQPDSWLSLAPQLEFAPVAVASSSHVIQQPGVKAYGKDYAFIGQNLPIAPLLQEIASPLRACEIVQRWSRNLPAQQALQILNWAHSEGLVCQPTEMPAPEAPRALAPASA